MKNLSIWRELKLPRFTKVDRVGRYDVIIIGGGITGLSAAYLLKKAGRKVCVLERDRICAVDTGQTSAHLTYVTDLRPAELTQKFGKDAARLVWEAGAEAIDTIESIARREGIECDFRRVPGFLHASLDKKKDGTDEIDDLKKEAQAASDLGFGAQFVSAVPYVNLPGIRFPNQARFHPLAYLAGLAERIDGDGSAIFEQSEAEIEDDPLQVKANGQQLEADYLVIATHKPQTGKSHPLGATLLQTKIYAFSSYVVGATVPKGLLPDALFWDTSSPYYYLRLQSRHDHDYAIFGGLDHKTGQEADTEKVYAQLSSLLLELVPQAKIDHRWSGQVVETNDMLPFIGQLDARQFLATGFAGNGLTFGTLSALMATDAALGRENPWQDIFALDRKKIVGGSWRFLRQNMDYPYYMLKDRLTPAEGSSPDEVPPGQGKILKIGGERVACYRNESGKTTMVSAVCTHMGCLVHWNDAERTWDCPCHGSRFKTDGEVLAGPADTPLEPVKPEPGRARKAGSRVRTQSRRRSSSPKASH